MGFWSLGNPLHMWENCFVRFCFHETNVMCKCKSLIFKRQFFYTSGHVYFWIYIYICMTCVYIFNNTFKRCCVKHFFLLSINHNVIPSSGFCIAHYLWRFWFAKKWRYCISNFSLTLMGFKNKARSQWK